MTIMLCSWKFTEEEKELSKKIVNATINSSSDNLIFVEGESLLYFTPEKLDVVVTFGPRPHSILKQKTQNLIALPLLSQLSDNPENVTWRKKAWEILKGFTFTNTEEIKQLELTSKEIIALYELAAGNLKNYYMQYDSVVWSLVTESGLKIAIVKDIKTKLNQKADFILTFEEILAAKAALDVLTLNKLLIVKGKKENDE